MVCADRLYYIIYCELHPFCTYGWKRNNVSGKIDDKGGCKIIAMIKFLVQPIVKSMK